MWFWKPRRSWVAVLRAIFVPLLLVCGWLMGCRDTTAVTTPAPLPTAVPTAPPTVWTTLPARETAVAPPQLHLTAIISQAISVQQPAYLQFELSGLNVAHLNLISEQPSDDGRLRLLDYQRLNPADQSHHWPDGVHESFLIWHSQAAYLADNDGNGDFVILWPSDDPAPRYTIQGQWCPADGTACQPTTLLYDKRDNSLSPAWSPADGQFQPDNFYHTADGEFTSSAGRPLTVTTAAPLTLSWRPLPDGAYTLGLLATATTGTTAVIRTPISVHNSQTQQGYHGYLDPDLRYRFLYPDSWRVPDWQNGRLATTSHDGHTNFQLTIYPNLPSNATATSLKTDTLNRFGAVDILFEEEVVIGQRRGLRTAYGYTAANGRLHTGILLTFMEDGRGYVLDVDGWQEEEAQMVTAVATLTASWQFLPDQSGRESGRWTTALIGNFTLPHPSTFTYQEASGWHRFSQSAQSFIALQQPFVPLPPADQLDTLLQYAADGLVDFAVSPTTEFSLGEWQWLRADFAYTATNGTPIWGYLMVTATGGDPLSVWVESPAESYPALEESLFQPMLAGLRRGG